jgi:hypothetical protein
MSALSTQAVFSTEIAPARLQSMLSLSFFDVSAEQGTETLHL